MSVISFFFPLPRVVSKQTQLNHNTLCPTVFPSGRSYHKTTTQHQQCRPLKGKGDRRKFFFFYFHHFKQSSNKLPSFSTFRGRSKASSSISFHIAISPALLPHFHAISHSSCFFFSSFLCELVTVTSKAHQTTERIGLSTRHSTLSPPFCVRRFFFVNTCCV